MTNARDANAARLTNGSGSLLVRGICFNNRTHQKCAPHSTGTCVWCAGSGTLWFLDAGVASASKSVCQVSMKFYDTADTMCSKPTRLVCISRSQNDSLIVDSRHSSSGTRLSIHALVVINGRPCRCAIRPVLIPYNRANQLYPVSPTLDRLRPHRHRSFHEQCKQSCSSISALYREPIALLATVTLSPSLYLCMQKQAQKPIRIRTRRLVYSFISL
jgi:hypothetical protein